MSRRKHGAAGRADHGEVFNLQHIAFDLEPFSAPQGQQVLRLLARLIACRVRRDELAISTNSMHTNVSAEPTGRRSI